MKKVRNVVLFFSLLLCFSRCENDRVNVEPIPQSSSFTVEQAEAWFGADWQGAVSLKSGNTENARIGIKPDWCNGFTSQNDEVEVVEVGLLTQGRFDMADEASYNEWVKTKNPKMIRSLTRMVFLKFKKDGRIDQFLMTIVGDKEYHGNQVSHLSDNAYLSREKHFSGHIYYHDVTGHFVNGWKYDKGKVTAKTTQTTGEGLPIRLKLATICKSTTSYTTYTNCNYWSQSNNVSSDIANFVECGSPYTIAVTTIDCETTNNTGVGSVGGGYAPPASQICNCIEKCTTCDKCLGSKLKSAALPDDGTTPTTSPTDPCDYCAGHPLPSPTPEEVFFDNVNKINMDSPTLLQEISCLIRNLKNSGTRLLTTDVIQGIGDTYNPGYEITQKYFNYQGHNVTIVVVYDNINTMNAIGKRTESQGAQVVFHEIYVRAKMNSARELPNLIRIKFAPNDMEFLNSVWNHINGTTNLWPCNY